MSVPKFTKKTYIIIISCVAAVALGICGAFALVGAMRGFSKTGAMIDSSSAQLNSSVSSGISSDESSLPVEQENTLVVTEPASQKITVTEPKTVIKGSCDPKHPLTINGKEVKCDENGAFSVEVELKYGNNSFVLEHKGVKSTYNIYYRYIIINSYNPRKSQSFDGGSTLTVTALARAGSEVTAEFNGQSIKLKSSGAAGIAEDDFCDFSGSFTIPAAKGKDQNLGKVKFTASYKGMSESFSSGNIICKKIYIPQIAEVVNFSAETFNGGSSDNCTRPTNNYLPQGTVDYVNGSFTKWDGGFKNNFLSLRCGRRIYSDMQITPGKTRIQVAKVYEGRLPDHNELGVAAVEQGDKYTKITLYSLWKAPFFLDLLPQRYTNPSAQDYTVSAFTAKYVEIKFCYATVFNGTINIPADNPIFSRSEIIKNSDSTTVRLYFKKTGAFYGWDCYYNSANQLVFEFRHPAKVSAGDNPYGVDLTGVKILIDAGHGGIDAGAMSGSCVEKERNLALAKALETELKKTGATVLMTRTGDNTINSNNRIQMYRKLKPDFLMSIHHDSSTSSSANGFGSYYTTPFSKIAANAVFDRTMATGIYNRTNWTKLSWHYFYMTRMTYCPAVLSENGFVSSPFDQQGINDQQKNQIKAKALAQGITDYFRTLITNG